MSGTCPNKQHDKKANENKCSDQFEKSLKFKFESASKDDLSKPDANVESILEIMSWEIGRHEKYDHMQAQRYGEKK